MNLGSSQAKAPSGLLEVCSCFHRCEGNPPGVIDPWEELLGECQVALGQPAWSAGIRPLPGDAADRVGNPL